MWVDSVMLLLLVSMGMVMKGGWTGLYCPHHTGSRRSVAKGPPARGIEHFMLGTLFARFT